MSLFLMSYLMIGLIVGCYILTMIYKLGIMGLYIDSLRYYLKNSEDMSDEKIYFWFKVVFTLVCTAMWPFVLAKFFRM